VKYRISCDLFLESESDANALLRYLEDYRNLFQTIKKGQADEQSSMISLERCYHDEPEPAPCEMIYTWTSD